MTQRLYPELGAPFDLYRHQLDADENPPRLWMLMGNSQMVGFNTGRDPLGLDYMPPNVLMLDADNNVAPFHYPPPFIIPGGTGFSPAPEYAGVNVSPGLAFIANLARQQPTQRFVVANCAVFGSAITFSGSTPASKNLAAPGSPYYVSGNIHDATVARANAAITQGCVLDGFFFHVGENEVADYVGAGATLAQMTSVTQTEVTRIINHLRSTVINDRFGRHIRKPCLLSEMPKNLTGTGSSATPLPGVGSITEAMILATEMGKRQVCRDTAHMAYVNSVGLGVESDQLHFSSSASRSLGFSAAALYPFALANLRDLPIYAASVTANGFANPVPGGGMIFTSTDGNRWLLQILNGGVPWIAPA